jgi:glycosyltransferase involved in cell wall biosynthesis
VFLIEPYAHERNGHAPANLVALATAATADGVEPFAILCRPVPPDTRVELSMAGARTVDRFAPRSGLVKALRLVEIVSRRISALGTRGASRSAWAEQVWLFARAFSEAASVRAARSIRDDGAIAILTSSDSLLGLSCYLGRHHHIRVVHKVDHRVGRLVRAVERLCARGRVRTTVWCPTDAVARDVRLRYPDLVPTVRPFAVVEPDQRITDEERVAARQRLGLSPHDIIAVLVGGWQPYKDPLTALEGLSRSPTKLVVIVAGFPIDARHAVEYSTDTCRIVTMVGPLDPATLRSVYAAASFSVVSRVAGAATESGLVMDAAKLGVPLVMSDNDPDLVCRLAGADWVTVFRAGEPASLTRVVDGQAFRLSRPPPTAPAVLGMLTSAEMVLTIRRAAVLGAGTQRSSRR